MMDGGEAGLGPGPGERPLNRWRHVRERCHRHQQEPCYMWDRSMAPVYSIAVLSFCYRMTVL